MSYLLPLPFTEWSSAGQWHRGPVAFIILIDDLAKLHVLEHSGVHVKKFADDMKVYLKLRNIYPHSRTTV